MTVGRTSFPYATGRTGSLGAGLKHGINQVCPCCKGGSTSGGQTIGQVDRIVGLVELKPFQDFYDGKSNMSEFNAYHCHSCGYEWSWYKLTQPHAVEVHA